MKHRKFMAVCYTHTWWWRDRFLAVFLLLNHKSYIFPSKRELKSEREREKTKTFATGKMLESSKNTILKPFREILK
jgi:hypothetical protein